MFCEEFLVCSVSVLFTVYMCKQEMSDKSDHRVGTDTSCCIFAHSIFVSGIVFSNKYVMLLFIYSKEVIETKTI